MKLFLLNTMENKESKKIGFDIFRIFLPSSRIYLALEEKEKEKFATVLDPI